MEQLPEWLQEALSPGNLVGHLSYILLIVSMLMRSMKPLRIMAVTAGTVSIIYGLFFLRDPVTVFWETIFTLTNLGQLLLLEWNNRRARFSEDEDRFISVALPQVERATARKLLRDAQWKECEAGTVLTQEGEIVSNLMFVLEGAIRIDKDGKMVGVCGHDDFLGEISFMLGTGATATSVVTNSVRLISFDRQTLARHLQRDAQLRHAMESSFNRSLVSKLVKSNAAENETAEAGATS